MSTNTSLGLENKKDLINKLIKQNHIDVCCIRETDVEKNKRMFNYCQPTAGFLVDIRISELTSFTP